MYHQLFIAEIMDEICKAKRADRAEILRSNMTQALRHLLYYGYNKNLKPVLTRAELNELMDEKYVVPDEPLGYTGSTLYKEYTSLPNFFNPRVSKDRLKQQYRRMQEILHPSEMKIFDAILRRNNLTTGLTEPIVREAVPNLLPEKE